VSSSPDRGIVADEERSICLIESKSSTGTNRWAQDPRILKSSRHATAAAHAAWWSPARRSTGCSTRMVRRLGSGSNGSGPTSWPNSSPTHRRVVRMAVHSLVLPVPGSTSRPGGVVTMTIARARADHSRSAARIVETPGDVPVASELDTDLRSEPNPQSNTSITVFPKVCVGSVYPAKAPSKGASTTPAAADSINCRLVISMSNPLGSAGSDWRLLLPDGSCIRGFNLTCEALRCLSEQILMAARPAAMSQLQDNFPTPLTNGSTS
jgi:hypothetical protein